MNLISKELFYRYIDQGVLPQETLTSDERGWHTSQDGRKRSVRRLLNQEFQNRGYDDYLKYMENIPDTPLIQMDTVKGCRTRETPLTLAFCNTNMMLMFIM